MKQITSYDELSLRVSYLGKAEYRLAVAKALANKTSVEAEIEAWRKQFEDGKVANLGSASFARTGTMEGNRGSFRENS
jgi:hypothetical protein